MTGVTLAHTVGSLWNAVGGQLVTDQWRTKVQTQKVSSGLWAMMWPHMVAVKGEHE